VAVTDVYAAQQLFGRGRRFDHVDIRLKPGVTIESGAAAVREAIGNAFRIQTPETRGADTAQLTDAFVSGFEISNVLALMMGGFLIFNVLTVAVDRRRRDIGILRTLGATRRQIGGLFLLEAAIVGAVGGLLGCAAGRLLAHGFISVMARAVADAYGL